MVRYQPYPKVLFQCRRESKLVLDQQWVKKDTTLPVLNAHTNILDNLSLTEIAKRFADAKENRRNEFGTFIEKNLRKFFCYFFT